MAAPRARLRRYDRSGLSIAFSPPFVMAVVYLAFAGVGAALLMTPWAQARPFGWGEALFTSVSAVTVTGLGVIDPGRDLTFAGQIVLAALIQLGGLGLMTFAVMVLAALGLPVGLGGRLFLRADLGQTSIHDLLRLVLLLLRFVAVAQLVGAALLCITFVPEMGWGDGVWFAVFHTVSAFNNAGFGLEATSLARWAASPVVNLVVPLLFILGGIGFSVVADVAQTRGWTRLTFHSKIMLAGTAALLVWSTAAFAALEWANPRTLGAFESPWVRLMAAWFQAATTRTAGFQTVDFAHVGDGAALMSMTLMLIGGGPTSTAGGIKVTTFVVMLLAMVAFFKRRDTLHAFGRSLGLEEVLKVLALTTLTMLLVMLSLFVLAVRHEGPFVDLAFEVTSAIGTVGLTRGMTMQLDGVGRGVVILLMLVGRVGPLTLGYFLATRRPSRLRYPSAEVYLG